MDLRIFYAVITVIVILIVFAAVTLYVFRFDIFRVSAESILRKNLPDYISVEGLAFDFKEGIIRANGVGIKNPAGYDEALLARIDTIYCKYALRGKNITEGIKITEITAERAVINIERLRNGRMNTNEMDTVIASDNAARAAAKEAADTQKPAAPQKTVASGDGKKVSDFIEFTDTINIRDAKLIYTDNAVVKGKYVITFEKVNATLRIVLARDLKSAIEVSSKGGGIVNGDPSQKIDWVISLDPRRQGLTMSNRFEVSGVEMTQFAPYYDRYSPISIMRGRFSGTLVCDLDNGNIGSMNTIKLSGLKFAMKEDDSAASLWRAAIPDLVKYLQSAPGEVIFDFKIKGDMKDPQFYPGPVVSRAIQAMAVDKITEMMQTVAGDDQGTPGSGVKQTDAEKAVDMIKALLKK